MRCLRTAHGTCLDSRKPSFTASRRTILDKGTGRVPRRTVACHASKEQSSVGPILPALLGAVTGLTLLDPNASHAMDQVSVLDVPEVNMEASAQPASVAVASNLADAPDLITDIDMEMAAHSDNILVTGLEWVVEGGLEVTNFTESNFAAVGAPSSSMWLSNSPWCLVWDAYCNVLTERPVATKLATGMVGTFLGDLLAQFTQGLVKTHNAATATIRKRSKRNNQEEVIATGSSSSSVAGAFSLDLSRTARLVGFSALVGTPVAFVWFNLLDQYVLPADPTNPVAVFSKVALDQVLMAPCMTSLFFAIMSLLEGSKREEVAGIVKAKLKPTLLANWTVWPIAHVVNFALVPPAHRILYINVINIAWTAFMSHMASSNDSNANQKAKQPAAVDSAKQLQQASR